MHMKHDARRFIDVHVEKTFQHQNDKFHRRIIIVENEHLVGAGLFGLGPRLGCNAEIGVVVVIGTFVGIVAHHRLVAGTALPGGFFEGEKNLLVHHQSQDMVFLPPRASAGLIVLTAFAVVCVNRAQIKRTAPTERSFSIDSKKRFKQLFSVPCGFR